jgi:hypothetical protein
MKEKITASAAESSATAAIASQFISTPPSEDQIARLRTPDRESGTRYSIVAAEETVQQTSVRPLREGC